MKNKLLNPPLKALFTLLFFGISLNGVAQSAPSFGAAANFALFTFTGAVANTGTTYITGDIGTNTGAITGFQEPSVVIGAAHSADSVTQQAAVDLMTAYNYLLGTTPTNTTHAAAFGNGETLYPGVYMLPTTASVAATLILDAQGNSNALFIFKFGGAFTTGAGANVILANGALAQNIFWIAEGAVAMAANTTMKGTLIANNAAISMAAGGHLHGRMYSTTGAVATDATTIDAVDDGMGVMVTSNQTICSGTRPDDLSLAGYMGTVLKWQRSSDDVFTSPIDIANTSTLLTGAAIGNLTATAYFRALVQIGVDPPAYSGYATVAINSAHSPDFGTAANFVLFTISGAVGNTITSTITGDIGTNMGIISGFGPPSVVNGNIHNADAVTLQASADLMAAYNELNSFNATNTIHSSGFGSGETLNAGVYVIGAVATVADTLNLDAHNNPNALFIFRIGGALTTGVNTVINLVNGALAENIFWVADGAIAMGAGTHMFGTLIAHNGAISMGAGGTIYGRMYSTLGAVAAYSTTAVVVGDGVGGTVSSNQSICPGTAPADLTLSGNTRNILKWQKSATPDFASPIDIACTSTTLTGTAIGTLTADTYFRAIVQRGACATVSSAKANVIIAGTSPGTLTTETATICQNTKPNPIELSGQIGNVIKWQSAADASFTTGLTDIASTATTLTGNDMGVIAATRYYRAVVQFGSCSIINTAPIQIIVPLPLNYSNGVWDGTPNETTPVIVSSNLTLAANLHVCSCRVAGTAAITVPPGVTLIVEENITVEPTANIILENNASLVQVDDAATHTGSITVKKNTSPMKQYDYSYWSAPVQNWRLNQLSPNTMSDKYYSFNPLINNWSPLNGGTQTMEPAKGYIIRAPQGWSTSNATAGVYAGSFTGVPNTGVVPVTIQKAAGTLNLIGNPYPSPIDIDLFLKDPANANIVNGTIYLWTHNTAISNTIPGNAIYNYTADDYAKYNLTGGIKTASTAIIGGLAPDGKIASGQGFFIEANTALANGTYTANFRNNMRIADSNSRFYRQGSFENALTAEKNRIWLTMANSQGAFNEILLGYITGATNGFDNLYDGKTFASGNAVNFYSISGTDNYSIQGRALPFNVNEIVPLGYQTTIAGTFSIAIENVEGIFDNQNVYLIDKLNNTTRNLKTGAYTFTSAAGTVNNRFEIRYTSAVTSRINNPVFDESTVIVYPNEKQINIHSTVAIESVMIYDIMGRQLFAADNINSQDYKTADLFSSNQALIVKVNLVNNYTVGKKVLMK